MYFGVLSNVKIPLALCAEGCLWVVMKAILWMSMKKLQAKAFLFFSFTSVCISLLLFTILQRGEFRENEVLECKSDRSNRGSTMVCILFIFRGYLQDFQCYYLHSLSPNVPLGTSWWILKWFHLILCRSVHTYF